MSEESSGNSHQCVIMRRAGRLCQDTKTVHSKIMEQNNIEKRNRNEKFQKFLHYDFDRHQGELNSPRILIAFEIHEIL